MDSFELAAMVAFFSGGLSNALFRSKRDRLAIIVMVISAVICGTLHQDDPMLGLVVLIVVLAIIGVSSAIWLLFGKKAEQTDEENY